MLASLLSVTASAERSEGMVGRLETKPVLDGNVAEDPAWSGLEPFTGFKQLLPDNGEPATQRTEVFMGFTGKALHVGVICYDDMSQLVISNDGFASDSFTFVLDTFRSEQTAMVFGTNPVGAEYDGQVAASGNFPDWNWSTVWEVRAMQHADHWSAEFEIPFSSLRYGPAVPGETQRWGVNFARVIRRHNETAYWSPVPKQLSMYRLDLAGVIDGFEPPKRGRNLKLMPYTLVGGQEASGDRSREEHLGFDVKYSLTPSLTLDLTYNTDFAQVESDQQQVNFGRFGLFFPETRPFFLENSGAFTAGSQDVLLFHSRRIGIGSRGERLPIEAGARLSGRVGNATNMGFLHMRADANEDGVGKTSFTVLRMSQDLRNRSSIGFIGTNRADAGNEQTWGLDGRWGIGNFAMLSGFVARTRSEEETAHNTAFSVFGGYNSPTWAYNADYTQVGAGFDPAIGFVGRRDFRKFNTFVQYTMQMGGRLGLSEWRPHASYTGYWDFDGFQQSGFLHVDSWFVWRNGADLWTAIDYVQEGVKTAFSVAGAGIPAGNYGNPQLNMGVNSPGGRPLRYGMYGSLGGYYDGDRYAAAPFISYRKDETLSAYFTWNFNRLDLPSNSVDVNLVQLRMNYSFTPKIGLQTLVQYNDASNELAANVRFSWLRSANAGLYLVYNEVDDRSDFPLRSRREVVLKYSHIFDVL